MAIAVVTAGAGARGAYEAGVLSVVVPKILQGGKSLVLAGTSAGALNTAIVAGSAHEPDKIAQRLRAGWTDLDVSKVFKLDPRAFWAPAVDAAVGASWPNYALLDTSPLKKTILETPAVEWNAFDANFAGGLLKAAAVVATQADTGESVIFVQGPTALPPDNEARGIVYRPAAIREPHVRASAAIPVLFPAVQVGQPGDDKAPWFMDGGVRLNTPISPAVDLLQAVAPAEDNEMVIVSTDPDPDPSPAHVKGSRGSIPPTWGAGPKRPDVIDEAATILHSMFVDRVAEDVLSLRRVNAVVEGVVQGAVAEGLVPAGKRPTRVHHRSAGAKKAPFETIRNCYFGPTRHGIIAGMAGASFRRLRGTLLFQKNFPLALFSRFLENRGPSHDEMLSFILFDPGYLEALFEQGIDDAMGAIDAAGGDLPWH